MKIHIIVIFKLLFFIVYNLYGTGSEYGVIEPSAYRSFIYTGAFDDTLLSLSSPSPGKIFPLPKCLDLTYIPSDLLTINLKKRDTRFNQGLEFNTGSNNIFFKQYNIFSQDDVGIDSLIHHGFIFKREGLFTTGIMAVKMFSPILKSGYKILSFNRLSLYKMEIFNLLEVRDSYISPLNVLQNDLSRIKTSIFIDFDLFNLLYINYITQTKKYYQKKNSIKVTFLLPFNQLSLKGQIRSRLKHEYLVELGLISSVWRLKNDMLLGLRYINSPLIKFNTTVTLDLDNIDISAGYFFLLENKISEEFVFSSKIGRKRWGFNVKYVLPMENTWYLEASISHK